VRDDWELDEVERRADGELHDHLSVSGSALLSRRDELVATSVGTGADTQIPGEIRRP
jgi:hypothetical protein